jgi:hypothetical protein
MLNTSSAADEVRAQDLSAATASLSAQAQDLRRQIGEHAAPGALAAAARALGMVPGAAPAFLAIGADGSVSVIGDPHPAPSQSGSAAPAPTKPPAPSPTPSASAGPTAAPSATAGGGR